MRQFTFYAGLLTSSKYKVTPCSYSWRTYIATRLTSVNKVRCLESYCWCLDSDFGQEIYKGATKFIIQYRGKQIFSTFQINLIYRGSWKFCRVVFGEVSIIWIFISWERKRPFHIRYQIYARLNTLQYTLFPKQCFRSDFT